MEIEMTVLEDPLYTERPEMAKPKAPKRGRAEPGARGRRAPRRPSGRLGKRPKPPAPTNPKPRQDWKAELKRRLMAIDATHFWLP
jgi:hypothetical protein